MEYIVYNAIDKNTCIKHEVFYTFDEAIDNIILNKNVNRLYLIINELKSKSKIFIPFALNSTDEKINREIFVFRVIGRIKMECCNNSDLDKLLNILRIEIGDKYGKI